MINSAVDVYFFSGCGRCSKGNTPQCKVNHWREVLYALREIITSTELQEERKWGVPCYTFQGKNVLILSAFNERCVVSFFKGSLLKDKLKILQKAGENTKDGRIIPFTSLEDVKKLKPALKEYIQEAIQIEKLNLKPKKSESKELEIPSELKTFFESSPELEKAFFELTKGRQRGYLLYFLSAKQSKTRIARIEKCIPFILKGEGLNEKYMK